MLRHNRHNKFIPCLSKKFKNWSFLWILIALLGLYAHVIGLWFFFFFLLLIHPCPGSLIPRPAGRTLKGGGKNFLPNTANRAFLETVTEIT